MSSSEKKHKGRDNIKILIIDPNEEDLKNICNIFISEGVSVFRTNSMEKAIKLFESEKPSLIISEYVLGEYNTALDLFRRVRKIDGDDSRTPFILHTNMKNSQALHQAELNGIDKYFIKPLSERGIDKLIRTSKTLIKHYKYEY